MARLQAGDDVLKFSRRASKTDLARSLELSAGSAEIRDLLLRRAKEKGSALRWNGYTLLLAYAILAAIGVLELRESNTVPVAAIAVAGLILIWVFSQVQARKIENQSLRDEIRIYMDLLSKQPAASAESDDRSEPNPPADSPLTERELEVLAMIAEGKSNKETAAALQISDQTVKNHISHIFAKLSVNDRTSAVLLAVNKGWIKGSFQRSRINT